MIYVWPPFFLEVHKFFDGEANEICNLDFTDWSTF